jgi:hypothetical protein
MTATRPDDPRPAAWAQPGRAIEWDADPCQSPAPPAALEGPDPTDVPQTNDQAGALVVIGDARLARSHIPPRITCAGN